MRFLVTGGAGFVGSHLCERLISEGHQVTVIDDLSTGRVSNLASLRGNSNFEFFSGSLLDLEYLRPIVERSDYRAQNKSAYSTETDATTIE